MSEENVEIVRRLQRDWNAGGMTVTEERFHPDVAFLPRRTATEGVFQGLSGVETFVADTAGVFDKFEMHFEFADFGERVLAWGTIHVRARQSGIETDIESGGWFEFRDGRIVRWEDFGSKRDALKAAGLTE